MLTENYSLREQEHSNPRENTRWTLASLDELVFFYPKKNLKWYSWSVRILFVLPCASSFPVRCMLKTIVKPNVNVIKIIIYLSLISVRMIYINNKSFWFLFHVNIHRKFLSFLTRFQLVQLLMGEKRYIIICLKNFAISNNSIQLMTSYYSRRNEFHGRS